MTGTQVHYPIFYASPEAMMVLDRIGKIIAWNQKAQTVFGFEESEVTGTRFTDLLSENTDKQKIIDMIEEFLGQEEFGLSELGLNFQADNKSGVRNDFNFKLACTEMEGQRIGVAVLRKITIQKKYELRLKEYSEFVDTIIEHIPHMIFVKEAEELNFVRFNKAGEELLGYKKSDLIGKNDYDFFPKEQADFFTHKDRDVIANGELLDIPEEPIHTTSGLKWLHTKKIPVYDLKGNPAFLVGISEDITQKREDEHRQKKLIYELAMANKDLEAFSYSASHDMRSSLRIMDGYTKLLIRKMSDRLNEDEIELLQGIVKSTQSLNRLLDDLMRFSKLGRKEMEITHVYMNSIVHEIADQQLKLSSKHITFQIDPLAEAECDEGLIRQVWQNLISNALKYSDKQEQPVIKITSKKQDREIIYSISDNGIGFDMQYAGQLFNVFHRLHNLEEYEGSGVGLALVKRILEKHNGRIWAESESGKGTTFYFTLPAA